MYNVHILYQNLCTIYLIQYPRLRCVTLEDTARFIANNTLCRTVYDLDSLVDSGTLTDEDTHQLAPNTTCNGISSDCIGEDAGEKLFCDVTSWRAAEEEKSTGGDEGGGGAGGEGGERGGEGKSVRAGGEGGGGADGKRGEGGEGEDVRAGGEGGSDGACSAVGDSVLHFESRFECGNLRKAIQVKHFISCAVQALLLTCTHTIPFALLPLVLTYLESLNYVTVIAIFIT